ncbi:nefa-interacting nuclear nip30 [Fusarium mundagurra]|uniref:Nefa-interacting nuclear nip30 n=1 Tax=Fusarium mundagurra TaxID=1567541 RepID=A0A8H5Y610_9HYPO|nr:nefa-interacting nuclear nip30 [Fusarium mundagurra]
MSSRFVSAGKIGSSGEISKDASGAESTPQQPLHDSAKSKEWEAVEQQLEAERKKREEQRIKAATGEGEKTLYDVLQANKAAKQAEFEEQTKLRNQFRALDDDEIEFLDEIRANKRAEEERVRRETEEGLKAFRERQKGDATQGENAGVKEEGESWEIGRKRKRTKEKDVKGLRRKVSAAEEKEIGKQDTKPVEGPSNDPLDEKSRTTSQPAAQQSEKKGLALVGYGSNSDDDD